MLCWWFQMEDYEYHDLNHTTEYPKPHVTKAANTSVAVMHRMVAVVDCQCQTLDGILKVVCNPNCNLQR